MSALTHLPTIRRVLGYLWTEHRVPNGPGAEAMMIAIGLQESRFVHRDQVVPGKPAGSVGPATGHWQFERNGGVAGVMQHPKSSPIARAVVDASGIAWDRETIWRVFATQAGDELAAAFARLLLFTDPAALPEARVENAEQAWAYYLRNWRPGKPHRATWDGFWSSGCALAGQNGAPAPAPPAAPARPDLEARVAALEARIAAMGRALA
jgi:hypothetical protein